MSGLSRTPGQWADAIHLKRVPIAAKANFGAKPKLSEAGGERAGAKACGRVLAAAGSRDFLQVVE
jgi:hypothetical protein